MSNIKKTNLLKRTIPCFRAIKCILLAMPNMSCPAGSTRNRETCRCRKSCQMHQARNPATGRCVTKNYLKTIQRQSHGPSDGIYYGKGSRKDYRDGLVPDASCHPRKRNIYTGYCKTPCGRGRAINPATGNCVTLRYLRTINPNYYDADFDDYMTAEILFTPTDLSTGLSFSNDVTKKEGFSNDTLTENDLGVMRGAHFNHPLVGVYSAEARKKSTTCKPPDNSSIGFNPDMMSACGLTISARQLKEEERYENLSKEICENIDLKKDVFVFFTVEDNVIKEDLLATIGETAATCPVRLLIPSYYGVWRFLVPKADESSQASLLTSLQLVRDVMNQYSTAGHFNSRKLANDVHEEIKNRKDLHVSFAPYPST